MTAEAMEQIKSQGVEIHEVDNAAFAAKVKTMLDNTENPEVRALLAKISAVESSVEPDSAAKASEE